jgi:RNA polymerase sigma-70 factor (ECF subfamily)
MMALMAERLETPGKARVSTREFGAWMASEQKRIFLLCLRMLQDREDADAATQDSFLKAFQALEKAGDREMNDLGKWITRIAVNTCLDRLRSRKWQVWRRRPDPKDESVILNMERDTKPAPDAHVFAGQIQARLARALDKLTPRQRAVFTLRHYEDHSLEEIGELMGLDIGTVKMHLFRTIRKLRSELHDLYFGRNHERPPLD